MNRIKNQIEAQIQEIVFFGSLILSVSIFLSGIFYIALSTETLGFLLGHFGAASVQGLFSAFGYGFFYLAVIALHMGYVTNYHVFNLRDFKREAAVLSYSLFAHLLILSLFSSLLTVFQVYLEIPNTQSLTHGTGGMMGALFGRHLYAALGIYGSLILILAFKIATAIVAEFFELHDLVRVVRQTTQKTAQVTVNGAKTLNAHLLNGAQFIINGQEFSEATAAGSQFMARSFNKANHIFTEHFHIYRDESKKEEPTADLEEKKDVKVTPKAEAKKVKMTSAMATRSEKLMNSLKELKKMTVINKSAKPARKSTKKTTAPVAKAVKPVEKTTSKKKSSNVKAK